MPCARFDDRARSRTLGFIVARVDATRIRIVTQQMGFLEYLSVGAAPAPAALPEVSPGQRRALVRCGRVARRLARPRRCDHGRRGPHAGHRPGHRHRFPDGPRHGHRRASRCRHPRRLDPRLRPRASSSPAPRNSRSSRRLTITLCADSGAAAAPRTRLEVPRGGQRRLDRPARRGAHLVGSAGPERRAGTRHRAARPAGRLAPRRADRRGVGRGPRGHRGAHDRGRRGRLPDGEAGDADAAPPSRPAGHRASRAARFAGQGRAAVPQHRGRRLRSLGARLWSAPTA